MPNDDAVIIGTSQAELPMAMRLEHFPITPVHSRSR